MDTLVIFHWRLWLVCYRIFGAHMDQNEVSPHSERKLKNGDSSSERQELVNIAQLYVLAGRICQFANIKYVIEVGDSFGASLVEHLNGCIFLGILPKHVRSRVATTEANVRVVNVDFDTFLQLDDEILQESLILWTRVDQHLGQHPSLAPVIAHWAKVAPYVIISHSIEMISSSKMGDADAPKKLERIIRRKFEQYLQTIGASHFLTGRNGSARDAAGVPAFSALGGTHVIYKAEKKLDILAIVSCFNDADIIRNVVRHLAGEGVKMHFIDNWSTDGTWEILQELCVTMPAAVVAIERFPQAAKDEHLNWFEILRRKEDIAHESPCDWFIHYDSDELRTSCWPGVSLADGLSFVDKLGYNVVNHFVIDFRPTKDGFSAKDDLKTFFDHFEFNKVDANVNQLKAWKKQPEKISLAPSGGHIASFPNRKVYPLCFLLAHYSLRSSAQARRKIYEERIPRVVKESSERRYHGHYRRYTEDKWVLSSFIWDEKELERFQPEAFHSDYFLYRLAGA